MDLQFEAQGRHFVAVDSGWKKNGYSVYDILDETGTCVDTVVVHPLDSIADAVDEWTKNYQGSAGRLSWPKWFTALINGV